MSRLKQAFWIVPLLVLGMTSNELTYKKRLES